MSGPQLIRVLAVSMCGVIIAQVSIVFYVYLLAWKRSPHRRGLVPCHVLGVSVFAVLTEIVFTMQILDLVRRDAPLSYYGPLICAANATLMVSLALIFRFDRRRISAALSPEDPAAVPARRAEDLAPPDRRWWGRARRPKTGP